MNLMDHNLAALQALFAQWGEPNYRAAQAYAWLNRGVRPGHMTNLPKQLRDRLCALPFGGASIYTKKISAKDGTAKYLFALEDGNLVEGVLMRYRHGNTLCLSTQVGCAMGCAFCASTLAGCVRDLTAGEMVAQVAAAESDAPPPPGRDRSVTNIVLMGSGEPLLNYDNVVAFLHRITETISPRNISLSTCGLVPQMLRFLEDAPPVVLSVSLHAPNDAIRSRLMPVNNRYGVAQVIAAARTYGERTGRRVIFEYALIKGVNDQQQHAQELAARLQGMRAHVNLIPLNPVPERQLLGVTRGEAQAFLGWLQQRRISATIRREMGQDIDSACGQLRRRVMEEMQ